MKKTNLILISILIFASVFGMAFGAFFFGDSSIIHDEGFFVSLAPISAGSNKGELFIEWDNHATPGFIAGDSEIMRKFILVYKVNKTAYNNLNFANITLLVDFECVIINENGNKTLIDTILEPGGEPIVYIALSNEVSSKTSFVNAIKNRQSNSIATWTEEGDYYVVKAMLEYTFESSEPIGVQSDEQFHIRIISEITGITENN